MKLNFITTCTNRKRFLPRKELQGRNLPTNSLEKFSTEWKGRLDEAKAMVEVSDLYCGRAFKEALRIHEKEDTTLYVISAGLGLIPVNQLIPPYSLTISKNSKDFIGNKIQGEPFSPTSWWNLLHEHETNQKPLANLLEKSPDVLTVIALPDTYIPLVKEDLLTTEMKGLKNLRIVGPRSEISLGHKLGNFLMPYNQGFDGPDSPIPGTKSDFAQRVERMTKR